MASTKLKNPTQKEQIKQLQEQVAGLTALLQKSVSSAQAQSQQNAKQPVAEKVTKFGSEIDRATPTHTTPTKKGNGVMLHLKGIKKNYCVYVSNEQLQKVKFGKAVSVKEYKKDGETVSSAVITLGAGLRKYTGLPSN